MRRECRTTTAICLPQLGPQRAARQCSPYLQGRGGIPPMEKGGNETGLWTAGQLPTSGPLCTRCEPSPVYVFRDAGDGPCEEGRP